MKKKIILLLILILCVGCTRIDNVNDYSIIIDKIINNNLIRTFDNNGKEILLMGCGLGFQKKIGDTIDRSKIEKIYAIENKNDSNKLMNLLSEIPLEYIQVSNEIISYAKY